MDSGLLLPSFSPEHGLNSTSSHSSGVLEPLRKLWDCFTNVSGRALAKKTKDFRLPYVFCVLAFLEYICQP